jgi:hypothetical protein
MQICGALDGQGIGMDEDFSFKGKELYAGQKQDPTGTPALQMWRSCTRRSARRRYQRKGGSGQRGGLEMAKPTEKAESWERLPGETIGR